MKRALGVDLGEARAGLAIGDELGMLAHPLETVPVKKVALLARLEEIVRSRDVGVVVVGVPRNMDGSEGPAAARARAFVESARQALPCRVVAWDERLTTVAAQRSLREAGRDARSQRAVIDQVAAQILLQSWLDAAPPDAVP